MNSKKAQGLIDAALLLAIVVVISLFAFTAFNRSKMNLANMSKVEVNNPNGGGNGGGNKNLVEVIVDIFNMDDNQAEKKIPYYPVEVSGALSMLEPQGMTQDQFNSYMSNITYGDVQGYVSLKGAGIYGDLKTCTNTLITNLGLSVPPIDYHQTSSATLASFVAVLNAIASGKANGEELGLVSTFISKFQGLLKLGQ